MTDGPLKDLLSTQTLFKMSSAAVYHRGVEYFKEGRVKKLKKTPKGLKALVQGGSESYEVQLFTFSKQGEKKVLKAHCTCKAFQHGFCKHLVALGLTALLTEKGKAKKKTPDENILFCPWGRESTQRFLRLLPPERLRNCLLNLILQSPKKMGPLITEFSRELDENRPVFSPLKPDKD